MGDYKYFIWSNNPDQAELGKGVVGLRRLLRGDPLLCSEYIAKDGRWTRDDRHYRYEMMGSTDVDFTEITPERALAILQAWVANGRLERLPSESQNDRPDDETIARFQELEDRVSAIWAAVPIPEGVENIRLRPGSADE